MSDWRNELSVIVSGRARATRAEQENALFETFLDSVALPALTEVADELQTRHGRETQVRRAPASVTLTVRLGESEEISFRVLKHYVQAGILPRAEARLNRGQRFVRYESMLKEGPQNYPISEVTHGDVIASFIKYYKQVMESGAGSAD